MYRRNKNLKLKEFDFDYPYEKNEEYIQKLMENGYKYLEATQKDYEEHHKKNRMNFRLQTRCITAFVERLCKTVDAPDFWKISINCVQDAKKYTNKVVGGVLEVYYKFNFDEFTKLTDIEKKKFTLSVLKENVLKVFSDLNIESDDFKNACEQVESCNYRNEWVWKRKKNKKITAEIALVHEIEKVEIFLRTYIDKEKKREFLLLETKPNEFYFVQYLGNLKWIDEETVFLEVKRGEEGLVINISTGSVKKVDCTF